MVKPHSPPPPKERTGSLNATIWLIAVAITGLMLYFGLPPFSNSDENGNDVLSEERSNANEWIFGYKENALTVEDIEKTLTPEELEAYRAAQSEVDEKFEDCIQYILYAVEDGLYECASCPPGIPFVTLKEGEIWYIGHTCQEENGRHSQAFQRKHGVWMFTNYVGSKETCHKVELKLIRGYKYLLESIKPEVKLILPPYNRTDKN